jgi:hypothetical protein
MDSFTSGLREKPPTVKSNVPTRGHGKSRRTLKIDAMLIGKEVGGKTRPYPTPKATVAGEYLGHCAHHSSLLA